MAADSSDLAAQVAALQQQLQDTRLAADVSWLLFNGALVFFMQCGFGMLEAGAVRSMATQSIMLKNLFDVSLGGALWWLVGYAFTNGQGSPFIGFSPKPGGGSLFATAGLMSEDALTTGSGLEWALCFFQFTFAAAAATIVSGAVAERAQLPAYLVFSSATTAFVYPVVAHWVWSTNGWLSVFSGGSALLGGVIDYAGAGVVHLTGGVAALIGSKVIGPRVGRFDESGRAVPMPGHSSVLQVLGTFILWLGWYGFNAGSTLGMSGTKARTAGRIVLVTTLSGASGGCVSVVLERFLGRSKAWEVSAMCNGILGGLVSITAGCATVHPWAALIMGSIGGSVARGASKALLQLKIDDPLDAFAVHGACGVWGVVAASLFSSPLYTKAVLGLSHGGLFYGNGNPLGAACVFIVAHLAWVGTLSTLIFVGLSRLGCLRKPHVELAAIPGGMTGNHGMYDSDSVEGSTHGGTPYIPGRSTDKTRLPSGAAEPATEPNESIASSIAAVEIEAAQVQVSAS